MSRWEDNENEVERADGYKTDRLWIDGKKPADFQDEYFDEPNFKKGVQPDPVVRKLLDDVAADIEIHGDAFFDPRGV